MNGQPDDDLARDQAGDRSAGTNRLVANEAGEDEKEPSSPGRTYYGWMVPIAAPIGEPSATHAVPVLSLCADTAVPQRRTCTSNISVSDHYP